MKKNYQPYLALSALMIPQQVRPLICICISGRYDLPDTHTELSEVVAGKKPGREYDQEPIIDFNIGLAIHDVVMAGRVLELARKL